MIVFAAVFVDILTSRIDVVGIATVVVGAVIHTLDIVATVLVIVVLVVLLGGQSEDLDQAMQQCHCPWCANGAPNLGLAAWGLAALTHGHHVHDVVLSEISWRLSNGD
jgi:hypothetical protein